MSKYLTPQVRRYVYGIAIAALPLLIGYGLLDKESAPLWVAFLGSVLVPGLALAHTPSGSGEEYEGDHRA